MTIYRLCTASFCLCAALIGYRVAVGDACVKQAVDDLCNGQSWCPTCIDDNVPASPVCNGLTELHGIGNYCMKTNPVAGRYEVIDVAEINCLELNPCIQGQPVNNKRCDNNYYGGACNQNFAGGTCRTCSPGAPTTYENCTNEIFGLCAGA